MRVPPPPPYSCSLSGCSRPRYSSQGIIHAYCGRQHALAANPELQRPHGVCNICILTGCTQQKYFDEEEQRNHDYCGWEHSKLALLRGERQVCRRDTSLRPRLCSYSECVTPVAVDLNGVKLEHCSKTHAYQACRSSRSEPHKQSIGRVYDEQYGGVLRLLSASDAAEYSAIESCVLDAWNQSSAYGGRRPTVHRIYVCKPDGPLSMKQAAYWCSLLKKYGDMISNNFLKIETMFHGTSSNCKFGSGDESEEPCFLRGCSLCGILLQGYQRKFAGSGYGLVNGKRTTPLRYGDGIYFTSSFRKASEYSAGSEVSNERGTFRTVFMATVAAGRSCTVDWKKSKAQSWPPVDQFGTPFDSVRVTENSGPNTLGHSYEDVAVYDDDAAVPSHLIVYSL